MSKLLKNRAIDPGDALRVAAEVAPHLPPARVTPDKPAMLSMRFRESTLESLASYAAAHGLTQKQVLAHALHSAGIRVASADMEDRPMPRRRGGRV